MSWGEVQDPAGFLRGKDRESARKQDNNGFWEIEANPISKVGVFPYLGAHLLGAADPMKVYYILRPADELGAQECIDSFKLQPWVLHHAMLGPEDKGLTPPDAIGVHGVIGEKVFFKGGTLYGNLKGFTQELKDSVESGKTELSAGYFHRIDWTPGIWNGQRYDGVQRFIRGNHLALVDSGRMGPDVAVMDTATLSFDINKLTLRKEAKMPEDNGAVTLEQVVEALKAVVERLDRLEAGQGAAKDNEGEGSAKDEDGAAKDNAGAGGEGAAKDNEGAGGEGAAKDEEGAAKDNAGAEGQNAAKDEAGAGGEGAAKDEEGAAKKEGEQAQSMDAALYKAKKSIYADIARRDALAKRLTPIVGSFDHSLMTEQEVAAYGCKKIGLNCARGQEGTALGGYLKGAEKATQQTYSLDAALGVSSTSVKGGKALDAYLKGGK